MAGLSSSVSPVAPGTSLAHSSTGFGIVSFSGSAAGAAGGAPIGSTPGAHARARHATDANTKLRAIHTWGDLVTGVGSGGVTDSPARPLAASKRPHGLGW